MENNSQGTINADFCETEFHTITQSMGAFGERVSSPAELEAALARRQESGLPGVIHVDVEPNQHLFAPGLQEFKAMHLELGGSEDKGVLAVGI